MSEKPTRSSVAVVGAGVGGLVTAAALQRRGFGVSVFERAPQLRRQGSGLTLYTNAVAALREMGLAHIMSGIAEPMERMVVTSAQGGRLAEIRLDRTARRFSAPSVNVHRSDLLDALASTVGEDAITFDAQCVGFEQNDAGAAVRFADGTEFRADFLVAADGAGSVVRRAIHGEEDRGESRRWSGWQGVAPSVPVGFPERALLVVLAGSAGAGFYRLTGGRIGWFLDDSDPRRSTTGAPTPEALLRRAEGWPSVAREAIAVTPPASIIYNEVRDLPPYERWGEGRVTLLGDAAHPMLPTLGQGACQAIEDAAALVHSLDSGRRLGDRSARVRTRQDATGRVLCARLPPLGGLPVPRPGGLAQRPDAGSATRVALLPVRPVHPTGKGHEVNPREYSYPGEAARLLRACCRL